MGKKRKYGKKWKNCNSGWNWGGLGGVREERTEHTKLFSRTFAGSGLTKRRASWFSWFSEILEFQCTRNGPQNLPFCPGSPQNTFILFSSIFQNQIFQMSFQTSDIWKSGNLKVWQRCASENNRHLSIQKCFNFRGLLSGDKTNCKTDTWELELSLGNFGSRISGLGNWAPKAGGTGWRQLGEPGGLVTFAWSLRHWVRTLLGKPS